MRWEGEAEKHYIDLIIMGIAPLLFLTDYWMLRLKKIPEISLRGYGIGPFGQAY